MTPINFNIADAMRYNDKEVLAIYGGGRLLWSLPVEEEPVVYSPTQFKGKFTDDSKSSDWWFRKGNQQSNKTTIAVDSATKEFDFEIVTTSGQYLFSGNQKIERIDHLAITSSCTNMSYLCQNAIKLKKANLSQINTKNVMTFSYMFDGCFILEEVDMRGLDLSKLNNFDNVFRTCAALHTINMKGLDFSKVTTTNTPFSACIALKNIIGPISGLKKHWNLSQSPLTHASAMVVINGLAEVSTSTSINFSEETYDTLTEAEIALATAKGWTIGRSF